MIFTVILVAVFAVLTIGWHSSRANMFKRTWADWVVDVTSLFIHFLAVPVVSGAIVRTLGGMIEPEWKGSIELAPWSGALAREAGI